MSYETAEQHYYDPPDEDETPYCPVCDAPSEVLGTLGKLTHYRCRCCGMIFNSKMEEVPCGK